MKNLTFTALLLFVGFALSAFARQTNTAAQPASGQNSSAQPATVDSTGPLQPPQSRDFWDGEDPSLAALIFHPYASKAYVKRHVEPIRDRLAELDELTESDQQNIRDVDSRAQQGIHLASDKANLADEHANDAAGKAQTAHQMASALDARLSTDETSVRNLDQYKAGLQTEILFRPGQTELSKQAKDALDAMAAPLKSQRGYILEVQGFSAGHGQAAIASSKKMADAVVRYLVLNHEIPAYRIYEIGIGNPSVDQHASTRIEISLLKNDLDQTASRQ